LRGAGCSADSLGIMARDVAVRSAGIASSRCLPSPAASEPLPLPPCPVA
jgi:hypothetical protein